MTTARFRVLGALDGAGALVPGTVEIDRGAGTFAVRPLRRRRAYTLPLATVATLVCQLIVRQELRERREAKKKSRQRRSKKAA